MALDQMTPVDRLFQQVPVKKTEVGDQKRNEDSLNLSMSSL